MRLYTWSPSPNCPSYVFIYRSEIDDVVKALSRYLREMYA